jgi:hypothetical protein
MHKGVKTLIQKLQTLNSIHKWTQNGCGGRFKNIGNTGVKHNYSSTHKIMVESIEKGVQLLMDSINWMQAYMHETRFALEEKINWRIYC